MPSTGGVRSGAVVFVGGCGHGDDVDLAVVNVVDAAGYNEAGCLLPAVVLGQARASGWWLLRGVCRYDDGLQVGIFHFEGWLVTFVEFADAFFR